MPRIGAGKAGLGKALVIGGLVALALIAGRQLGPGLDPAHPALESHPDRVMGTSCRLLAVPPGEAGAAEARAVATAALERAEAEVRTVEAQMSTWIDASPVSRLNRAPAGLTVELPAPVLTVLERSRVLHADTAGAFDVTCRPLIELWREAGQSGRLPSPAAVEAARQASSWSELVLLPGGARKQRPTARVDLGGIAKGYGIDRAIAAMRAAGVAGALVDIGGDLRVFGRPGGAATPWEVKVRNPAGEGTVATLRILTGAVCTSGDYARFVEIQGRRFSHIIDPRTGQPATAARSATVLAPDAMTADGWATALCVLGETGLSRLPRGVEALLVSGGPASLRAVVTPGMRSRLAGDLPYPTRVAGRARD
jgi:thiamine biosynthesis lipoprotein